MEVRRLHMVHPLPATMEVRRLHMVHPLPALALKRSLLDTSCNLKKDISFKEQGKPIRANWRLLPTLAPNRSLRLRLDTSCSLKKDVSFKEPGTSGTLVAPESRVATVSDVNGTLVAPEDTNGTLVPPESHVATTRIDWIGMSNEEFKKRIKEMAQSPLPRSHLMSEEEFVDFCIRREEMLYQAGKMVSKFYQDVDLPTQLHQLRGEQFSESDTVSLEHGTVAQKAKVKRTRKSSLDNFNENGTEIFKTIQGKPTYIINMDKTKLFLPQKEIVALDTCIMIYYAQAGVQKYEEKSRIVRELLRLPLEFVVADLVHLELFRNLLKDKIVLKGIEKRVVGMLKKDANDIRDARLHKVKEMFDMMDAYHFVQAERGRNVTKNLIDIHSRTQVQPDDGRIMLEVADVASILCTEDCQHMQPHKCRKGDQMHTVYPWHVLTNKLSTY